MITKHALRDRWKALKSLDDAPKEARRKRGYEFEKLLFDLLALEGLELARPYRSLGEQIDGLIEFNGRFFLVETKWHTEPLPASEIYQLRAKVEGKFVGTCGIFVSVSGVSKYAVDALKYGKTLNILLFDGEDIELALLDEYSFSDILRVKLRRAAQYGTIDYAYAFHLQQEP